MLQKEEQIPNRGNLFSKQHSSPKTRNFPKNRRRGSGYMQCRRLGYDQVGLPFWEFDRYLNLQSQILSMKKSWDHRKTCPRLWDERKRGRRIEMVEEREEKREVKSRCLFAGRKRCRKRLGVAETECTQSLCVLCGSKVLWIVRWVCFLLLLWIFRILRDKKSRVRVFL